MSLRNAPLAGPVPSGLPQTAAQTAAPSAPILWGVLLSAAVAAAATALTRLPGLDRFSPMILSIILGIAVQNAAGLPAALRPGLRFCMRRVLRLGIMLLGLRLTLLQLTQIGLAGIAVILLTLTATFLATCWIGRRLGIDGKLVQLIAAGTSICGASAVIATNTVTQAADEDVAYAVACVTVFGSAAMFLYPLLQGVFGLDAASYGLWAGASIHEIAQVVAAAFQGGDAAGQVATIAKLARVVMLAPLVLGLGFWIRRRTSGGRPGTGAAVPVPWFVFGFVALVGVNSVAPLPAALAHWTSDATTFLLTVALAAMGLETNLAKLGARGVRPLGLAALSWLFIAGFGLGAVVILT